MPSSFADRLLRHGAVAFAAALGLGGLSRWTLWQDEAFTWMLEQRDLAGMIDGAAQDRHPPLFYLVVSAFRWLGDRDFALRMPSALAYIGAVALVRVAGERHGNRFVGTVASWVIALSPVALLFAHTARMYAMLLFWASLLLLAGLEVARGARPGRAAVLFGVATAGAIWTHYAGVAAVAAAAFGTALSGLTYMPGAGMPGAGVPGRGRRALYLTLALVGAGVSFLPWAMGPLQFQLSEKDVPSERTWTALGYLWWAFDSRIPPLSWALAALQLGGLGVALRRRDGLGWMVVGLATTGIVAPYVLSSSGPAQNPRNYLDFLPAAALLVGLAGDALRGWITRGGSPEALAPRLLLVGALGVLAADPLVDLWTRSVSPQEPGVGFDYAVEADVLDASAPANGGLYFRPSYLLIQYRRYAPALADRMKRKVDHHAWLAVSRGEWLDSGVAARYTQTCTFKFGFRVVLYTEAGPGCDAVLAWTREVAATGYVPFLQELARRALDAGDMAAAESYAARAVDLVRGHPGAALTLAEVRVRTGDGAGALAAADRALAVSREWHLGGGAIAQSEGLRAQALGLLGRGDEAKAALAVGSCAKKLRFPNGCGAWWEPAAALFVNQVPPTITYPPLPALSESQSPDAPVAAPVGAERLALWPFEGEVLPEGWVDSAGSIANPGATMETAEGSLVLAVQTAEDRPVALACGPLVPASPHMALRTRWRADVSGGEGRSALTLEARMADASGQVLKVSGVPVMERPLQTGSASGWRVDRFDFRTRVDATQVRVCAKVEGARQARLALDWLEIAAVPE